MRKLFKVYIAFLIGIVLASNVQSQSTNRPWLIGFGINSVDLHGLDSTEDILETEFWNTTAAVSHLTIGRALNASFGIELQLAATRITADKFGNNPGGLGFYNAHLNFRYKFDNGYIIKENAAIAPYLFAGGGIGYMSKDESRPNAGGGVGLNIWLWEEVGIYGQTSYNWANQENDYLQHSAGVVIRFGQKDSDDDGIADEEDACPEEAGPPSTKGCPDKDGDLVPDQTDACPDVAGLATLGGCPDADGDGIADKDDRCPNEKGSKEMQGCPDKDGDGITDKDDQCPDQKGLAQFNGCPDTDGDGIADKDDACPTQKGTAALQGCPDRDGDGVADNKDRCPDQAGPASNGGCPVPKKEEIEKITVGAHAIQFVTGSDKIQKGSFKILDEIYSIMNQYPQTKWEIEGHTDDVGKDDYNMDLSNRRAASVKNYFISKGIAAERLSSHGYGETKPVADNKTSAGKAKNRRVEIILIEQQ